MMIIETCTSKVFAVSIFCVIMTLYIRSIARLQLFKKCRKLGLFHTLSTEGLCDDLLTAVGL